MGDGPLKEQLNIKARQLGIEGSLHFLAPVDDPLPYYRSLNLYLNTSRHEGIPLSILEAMACGLTVVAPAVGGVPEIISNEVNGFLVNGRESDAFAEACLKIIKNSHLNSLIGANAARKVQNSFDSAVMSKAYGIIYGSAERKAE